MNTIFTNDQSTDVLIGTVSFFYLHKITCIKDCVPHYTKHNVEIVLRHTYH